MKNIQINKPDHDLNGAFQLPYSKSESNRALIIKALANQKISIKNLSEAEDTLLLNRCLRMIETCGVSRVPMVVNAGHAGTAMRFLTAYLAVRPGKWLLKGSDRMHQRPIKPLVDALNAIGGNIKYADKEGFPPLLIQGGDIKGGEVSIDANISSQYISALLMIAPMLEKGLKINIKGKLISRPYVLMTIKMMKEFGVEVDFKIDEFNVSPQSYVPKEFFLNPDWSAASYAFELIALSEDGSLSLPALKPESLQGDRVLTDIFKSFGVESVFTDEGLKIIKSTKTVAFFEYDFIENPDLAQTLIATCVGLGIEARLKGLESLRIKETDRIAKMDAELSVLGFRLKEDGEEWFLTKEKDLDLAQLDADFKTYDDHRMAMSLAALAMKLKSVKIENMEVVSKSFPAFWNQLENLGFQTATF